MPSIHSTATTKNQMGKIKIKSNVSNFESNHFHPQGYVFVYAIYDKKDGRQHHIRINTTVAEISSFPVLMMIVIVMMRTMMTKENKIEGGNEVKCEVYRRRCYRVTFSFYVFS